MTVVERCPNCGTTQAAAGECQACHEAPVRYFCTNHEPGIWLAGPTCPQCEAPAVVPARPAAVRKPLRDRPPREAVVVRRAPSPAALVEREPAPLVQASGWLKQLAIRLVLIALVLVAALGFAVYLVARSLQ